MKFRMLFVLILMLFVPFASAQSDELLAFMNGSGQLVVSSGDGQMRWIVTNPGQVIDAERGFGWDADGNLIFALDGYGVFVGDPIAQSITPVESTEVDKLAFLRGTPSRPNTSQPDGLSADGQYAFVWADGRYFTVPVGTTSGYRLRLVGENANQSSGLWSDVAPFVAYWGFNNDVGGTALAVWNPTTEIDIVLNSGGTIPIPPIAWIPNTMNLVFRISTGDVYVTNVDCLTLGCIDNPLEMGVMLAPPSANHIQVTADHAYYVDSQIVYGVDLRCLNSNSCLDSRFVIGENVVPLSMMHVSNEHLVYTSFASDSNNAMDRIVQLVDLTCVPDCRPQAIINGAIAGVLSSSGDFLLVDIVGEGLNILNITDGGLTYLTNSIGGQAGVGLNTVAWR